MLIQKWQNNIKEKRAKYLASRPRPDQIKDYSEDEKFKSYLDKLYELRKDGVIKLDDINTQIREIKTNKLLKKEEKEKLIKQLKIQILESKVVINDQKFRFGKKAKYQVQLLLKQNPDKSSEQLLSEIKEIKEKAATKSNEYKINKTIFREKLLPVKEEYNKKKIYLIENFNKSKQNIINSFKSKLEKVDKNSSNYKKVIKELKSNYKFETKKLKEQFQQSKIDLKRWFYNQKTALFISIVGDINPIKRLTKEAIVLSKERLHKEYKSVKTDNKIKKLEVKEKISKKLAEAKDAHIKNLNRIKNSTFKNKQERNLEIQNENNAYEAIKSGLTIEKNDKIQQLKQDTYACYLASDSYNKAIRNGKRTVGEKIQSKWHHFKANFDFMQFVTKYALYMIIVLIFIALVIWSATKGVQLLSGESILTCLRQIAPKIFFSLGAACLILLGGTDLSIGRLTGIGVSFTLMILSSTNYSDNNGIVWFATGGMSGFGRVILALIISIGFCTLFTSLSGFFTAKFKIHPFITTLATQLISYGLFQIFWSATSTFSPTDKDTGLMEALRGSQGWQLILYAVIAIAIVWFIWNKTKFGKNLYAVGGNQEAAKVSGINPFIITLLAFVMAGILYGCGGFVQAVQTGTGNFTTGYGTETDAIAACVIGGISFTGGIGKVSGAVIGTVVLGFLTFAFSSMGMDANLQLVIKGIIIILAVTLDCVKYIKKK